MTLPSVCEQLVWVVIRNTSKGGAHGGGGFGEGGGGNGVGGGGGGDGGSCAWQVTRGSCLGRLLARKPNEHEELEYCSAGYVVTEDQSNFDQEAPVEDLSYSRLRAIRRTTHSQIPCDSVKVAEQRVLDRMRTITNVS